MASLPHVPQPELLKTPNPSEPADAWASSTLDAVKGEQNRTHDLPQSNISTPGFTVPGAFPLGPLAGDSTTDVDYVRGAAFSAIETARDLVGSAGEKVAHYIPAGMSAYLPTRSANNSQSNDDSPASNGLENLSGESLAKLPEERKLESLPSHDDDSAVPFGHTGGVGTLPGDSTESGVAKLPEERIQESRPSTRTYLNPSFTQASGPLPPSLADGTSLSGVPETPQNQLAPSPVVSYSSTTGTARTQDADTDASTRTLIGSHNADANTPPTPQKKSDFETLREHDEAALSNPKAVFISSAEESRKKHENDRKNAEDRKTGKTVSKSAGEWEEGGLRGIGANKGINTSPRTHPLAASPVTFNSIPLSEAHQHELDMHPSEQLDIGRPSQGKLVGASVLEEDKGKNLDINSPRNEGPVVPEKMETKRLDSTTENVGHEGQGGGAGIAVPGGPGGSYTHTGTDDRLGSGSHKVGFMSKVKGEMKIISGKLGHNEDKVEEGRKMMGRN